MVAEVPTPPIEFLQFVEKDASRIHATLFASQQIDVPDIDVEGYASLPDEPWSFISRVRLGNEARGAADFGHAGSFMLFNFGLPNEFRTQDFLGWKRLDNSFKKYERAFKLDGKRYYWVVHTKTIPPQEKFECRDEDGQIVAQYEPTGQDAELKIARELRNHIIPIMLSLIFSRRSARWGRD